MRIVVRTDRFHCIRQKGLCLWGVALCLLCGVSVSPLLVGQGEFLRLSAVSAHVSAQWLAADGTICLHSGPEILQVRPGPEEPSLPQIRGFSSPARGRAQTFDFLSESQWVFTRGRNVHTAQGGEAQAITQVEAPVLDFDISPYPIRLPLLALRGMPNCILIPGRPQFSLLAPGTTGTPQPVSHPLAIGLGGSSELGWGVGDPLVIVERFPTVLAIGVVPDDTATVPHRRFLVGAGAQWELRCAHGDAGSCLIPLARIPGDSVEGILEFPWSIPPQVGDLDADGQPDALFADASSGTLALFTDLLRSSADASPDTKAELTPNRVWLAGGLILMTWVFDGNGDGHADLFVLRASAPGLAAQLRILQQGTLNAELLVYDGSSKGLPRSPSRRRKLTCGLTIGIENELREAQFTSIVQPLSTTKVLHVHPNGEVQTLSLTSEESTPLGTLPKGQAAFPFQALRIGASNDCILVWRSSEGDSVWTLRLP